MRTARTGVNVVHAIITEMIFSWEGIGSLMVESIARRDYAQVRACGPVIAITYVLGYLFADLTYRVLDPRTRLW